MNRAGDNPGSSPCRRRGEFRIALLAGRLRAVATHTVRRSAASIVLVAAVTAWLPVRASAVPQTSEAVPAPASTAFPTIGRTRSKRYCPTEIDRVNGAITVALTNDKIIATGIARLRSADLDAPERTVIETEKSMHDLRAIAAAVQTNLRAGGSQVADLHALAIKEPDAARSPELKELAERIDQTYEIQRSIGADLAKMLTIIDGRYAGAQAGRLAASVMPEQPRDHVQNGLLSIDQRAAREPRNQLFADVADEFGDRVVSIGKSEDAAAVHAPKAVSGC